MFKGSLRCFCLLLVLALLPLAGLAQEGEAPAYVSKDVLLVDGSIRYNDPDVARGIEEAMQGQGDPTDPKDVAKYATFIGVGFPNSNNYLDYCRAYGDVEITSAVTFDASSAAGVTDLSCLQFCTNARVLFLNCKEVTGLEVLEKLPKLESIYIHTDVPVDLTPLQQLKKLKNVGFNSCKAYDYLPLNDCPGIKGLVFNDCGEVDLLFVLGLKKLDSFTSTATSLHNAALLATKNSISVLDLSGGMPEAELNAVLSANKKIDLLVLDGFDLAGLDELFASKSLFTLCLSNCTGLPTDPETWASLSKMYSLTLDRCDLKDPSVLQGMRKLFSLSLTGMDTSDLFSWLDCLSLTDLFLDHCTNVPTDPERWAEYKKMEALGLDDCGLTDVSFLTGLAKLEWLSLSDNDISDLSFLSALPKLSYLYTDGDPIKDFSPVLDTGISFLLVSAELEDANDPVLTQLAQQCEVAYGLVQY